MNLFEEFKTARPNVQEVGLYPHHKHPESLLNLRVTTSESVSWMNGQPGNFSVDVVSNSFPDVDNVVQKLENTVLKHLKTHEHGKCKRSLVRTVI